MELIDMKRPKRKGMDEGGPVKVGSDEPYPYGLRLRFEADEVDKLPMLSDLGVDDAVRVEAFGYIRLVSVDEVSGQDGRYCVEVQLERVGVEADKAPEKMDMKEYASWRKKKGRKG